MHLLRFLFLFFVSAFAFYTSIYQPTYVRRFMWRFGLCKQMPQISPSLRNWRHKQWIKLDHRVLHVPASVYNGIRLLTPLHQPGGAGCSCANRLTISTSAASYRNKYSEHSQRQLVNGQIKRNGCTQHRRPCSSIGEQPVWMFYSRVPTIHLGCFEDQRPKLNNTELSG